MSSGDTQNPPGREPEGPTWPAGRKVAATLSVVTVIALLVGIAGMVLPKAAEGTREDDVEARQAVLARASDFVTAFNTYSAKKPGDYQKRVGSLLTDDFRKEFKKASSGFLKALKKKNQTSGEATVLGAAVDSIDGDSAEVVIAVDATIKNSDRKKPIPRHFRWRVSLERADGEWKVSKYTPVSTRTPQQDTGQGGSNSEPSPSAPATSQRKGDKQQGGTQ